MSSFNDEMSDLDDSNLRELNEAYQFCIENKARSFCTYPFLIPFIENNLCCVRLVSVIDFPEGNKITELKIFEAGQAYEMSKKAIASEVDVVLFTHSAYVAKEDILGFSLAKLNDIIGIKYIIGLGSRLDEEVLDILSMFDPENGAGAEAGCKYIKTNTGRELSSIPFEKKIKKVEWLRKNTHLPIKVSGGIELNHISKYDEVAGMNTIYGISYNRLVNS
jgi:deoxyribose-phosphate aldolase